MNGRRFGLIPLVAALVLGAGQLAVAATGPGLFNLHSFVGSDGRYPAAGLLVDTYGSLYGTTELGGSGGGAIFRLAPPATEGGSWTETVLYRFAGGADGSNPTHNLVFDSAGALYGTTLAGGAAKAGTVFQLAPPKTAGATWTETVFYQFTGAGGDGRNPSSAVIFDTFGALYGVTEMGGVYGNGAVFALTPPGPAGGGWTETILYSFRSATGGGRPGGDLIFDTSGSLYGTLTMGPGARGSGRIFKLTRPAAAGGSWTESAVYDFAGGADGASPANSLIFDSFGALYGTTTAGGASNAGTVFKLMPPAGGSGPWTKTTLYSFAGGSDGAGPSGNLMFDSTGTLYGTTRSGGASNKGTIYKLAPSAGGSGAWTETVLYSFTGGVDGGQPTAGLAVDGSGAVYGTTAIGGDRKSGTVFRLQP